MIRATRLSCCDKALVVYLYIYYTLRLRDRTCTHMVTSFKTPWDALITLDMWQPAAGDIIVNSN